MEKSEIILRIKKSSPYIELYTLGSDKKIKFTSSYNNISDLNENVKACFVFLSSVFCVCGVRSVKGMKNIKVNSGEFYFSHKTISTDNELKFSEAIVDNDILKQSWVSQDDYNELIKPLIKKFRNKIYFLGPETALFAAEKKSDIIISDGENHSKLLQDGSIEVIPNYIKSYEASEQRNKLVFDNINFNKKLIMNYPYFLRHEKDNFILKVSLILLITLILHASSYFFLSKPIYKVKLNYFITSLGYEKVNDPNKIIAIDENIQKRFNLEMPRNLILLSNHIGQLNNELIDNMVELNYLEKGKLSLKFKNYLSSDVYDYIQSQKDKAEISIDEEVGEVLINWNFELN